MFKGLLGFRKTRTKLNEELEKKSQAFLNALLKERDTILNSSSYNESRGDLDDLKDLGFINAKSVVEYTEFNKTIKTVLQSILFIEQAKREFGESTLIIRQEDLQYLINKYDLVCGPFNQYLGSIPQDKISKIKSDNITIRNFTNNYYAPGSEALNEFYHSYHLVYLDNLYYSEDKLPEEVKNRVMRFGMFSVPYNDSFFYMSLGGLRDKGVNYIENILGVSNNSLRLASTDLTSNHQNLFICAPSKEMNVGFSSKVIKYPDPLICSLGINNSVVVHTMWGPESEDPILDKYKK